MISARTIALFIAAIVTTMFAFHGQDSQARCSIELRVVAPTHAGLQEGNAPEVGFNPCFVDAEPGGWNLVLGTFFIGSWLGLIGSFIVDCFVYVRGRRLGVISGGFQLLR